MDNYMMYSGTRGVYTHTLAHEKASDARLRAERCPASGFRTAPVRGYFWGDAACSSLSFVSFSVLRLSPAAQDPECVVCSPGISMTLPRGYVTLQVGRAEFLVIVPRVEMRG